MSSAGEEGHASFEEILNALVDGKLIETTSDDGIRIEEAVAPPDPGDGTIADPVVDDSGEPWMYVGRPDDAEFGFDLVVEYSDEFAAKNGAAIEESVAFLRSLPGVVAAFRDDPEQAFVIGTRDAVRLRDSLVGWWDQRRS